MSNKQKNGSRAGSPGQLMIPLVALGILILFNLFRDPSFFAIGIAVNNSGNSVLSGNLISIIDSASALAIISMGMTLVTAACGGQDISVGAVGAIAGSFFVKVLNGGSSITLGSVILGIIVCCLGTIMFMLFNGTLVSVFRIQPMIATLILFSCGRSIAYWINGSATPQLISPIISAMGMTIPGIPIPTPIFAVILMGVLLYLVFKFTNLRLYTQSVGINEGAARLNGVNPVMIKLLSFVLLGVCVSVAAVGAYIIQMLTTTLYAMNVAPVNVKAYKAIVIIIIVVAGSPVIKAKISSLITRLKSRNESVAEKGVA